MGVEPRIFCDAGRVLGRRQNTPLRANSRAAPNVPRGPILPSVIPIHQTIMVPTFGRWTIILLQAEIPTTPNAPKDRSRPFVLHTRMGPAQAIDLVSATPHIMSLDTETTAPKHHQEVHRTILITQAALHTTPRTADRATDTGILISLTQEALGHHITVQRPLQPTAQDIAQSQSMLKARVITDGRSVDSKVKMSNMHTIFENVTMTTGSPGRPEESDCPICDETMVDQETLTHTNGTCNHSYHRACWEKWMLGSPPATCPMDRERLRLRERISSSATTQDLAIYNAYMDTIDQQTMRAGRTVAGPRIRLFNFLNNLYRERGLLLYVARDGLLDPVFHFVGEEEYVRRSIEDGAEDIRVASGALNDTSTV
ncbi:Mitogen-activated protein kinase kinase kinase 1 [Exophiala xenobiotica]|uniref:Mitogen-activated protein kinase kinase kinase 1 n=1 Tax=Lithohypha guttulata TaxID=1690604 RepID=A0ABR0K4U3_9EURO|nr:Mitogen-activated protein kinase kinase kinase 1 [Lithohypha guttulata]KAK5314706.1 Mitogen-activated protein kinase kinase kinase 1 [Exophiala xenobiotica]